MPEVNAFRAMVTAMVNSQVGVAQAAIDNVRRFHGVRGGSISASMVSDYAGEATAAIRGLKAGLSAQRGVEGADVAWLDTLTGPIGRLEQAAGDISWSAVPLYMSSAIDRDLQEWTSAREALTNSLAGVEGSSLG